MVAQLLSNKWPCDCRHCQKTVRLSSEDGERARDEVLIIIAKGCMNPYKAVLVVERPGYALYGYGLGKKEA